jgi:hypothetical protein
VGHYWIVIGQFWIVIGQNDSKRPKIGLTTVIHGALRHPESMKISTG